MGNDDRGRKNKSSEKKLCNRYRKALEPDTNTNKRCTNKGNSEKNNQGILQDTANLKKKFGEMSAGCEDTQSGETRPEKSSDLVRPTGNHNGIANIKEKSLADKIKKYNTYRHLNCDKISANANQRRTMMENIS